MTKANFYTTVEVFRSRDTTKFIAFGENFEYARLTDEATLRACADICAHIARNADSKLRTFEARWLRPAYARGHYYVTVWAE